MSLPTLPTGPVHVVLPPGVVGSPLPTTIKICPTGPSGIIYNENSPTGPGSGHETQPPNQPPGTTQGPTLPGPVIVPSGPSLTGPGPTYRELYRETHISKNIKHLQIQDPSPTDPYEVNFIPTVVNYESTKPNLLQINQTDTADIKFTPTTINYESTNLDTLTIDQSDPTHILFTAVGGGVDIFGNTRTLWVAASNVPTTAIGDPIINGVTVIPHGDITYNVNGTFTFTRGGYYLYSITGKVPAPGSSGNFAIVNFNPDSASLNGGRPSKIASTVLIPPNSFETTANVAVMTGMFTSDITTFRPTIQTSWNVNWTTINVVIATIYGPETAGNGGGGAIEWVINPQYQYQSPYNFDPNRVGYGTYGIQGAPYGNNGLVPPHAFIDTDYIGNELNPLWYPNGQMYLTFPISPSPNLTVDDITVTVEAWDSSTPSDIIVRPYNFNAGIGVFTQGFVVWLPFIQGNYIGTSFRLNVTITGIVDDHKIYFKYSPEGQNGCEDYVPYLRFMTGTGDNVPAGSYDYYNNYTTTGEIPFPRRPAGNSDNYHLMVSTNLTLWDDPANLTFEYTGNCQIWTGYYFVDYQLGDSINMSNDDLFNYTGISPPTIRYIPPTDISTFTHPYPWAITPVGHWVFSYENGPSDYFADTTLWGYYPSIPAYPPWYEFDNKWPVYWEINIKYKGVIKSTVLWGHGIYYTGH